MSNYPDSGDEVFIMMKEIDSATQKKISISAYWRRRQADEANIGYGFRKDYLALQMVSILFSSLMRWFIEPRIRPAMKHWMRLVYLFLPGLSLAFISNRGRKATGFYQLDDEGMPVLFLSRIPPESIQGRIGTSRNKFLSRLRERE